MNEDTIKLINTLDMTKTKEEMAHRIYKNQSEKKRE